MRFIFAKINPSSAPSVADQFKPYLEELSLYKLEDIKPLGRVTMRPRDVNWKQVADNYVDALHIPVAHPGLSGLVGNSYGIELSETEDLFIKCGAILIKQERKICPMTSKNYCQNLNIYLKIRNALSYYRLWPNLAFDIYPDQMDYASYQLTSQDFN